MLVVVTAGPALAGRVVVYRGETSTGVPVAARVLRRDSGRLFLAKLGFGIMVYTCDEGQGDEFGVTWNFDPPHQRLADDGSFAIDEAGDLVAGRFSWGDGEGSFELSYPQGDGVCTSGELTWTVTRTRSLPVAGFHRQ